QPYHDDVAAEDSRWLGDGLERRKTHRRWVAGPTIARRATGPRSRSLDPPLSLGRSVPVGATIAAGFLGDDSGCETHALSSAWSRSSRDSRSGDRRRGLAACSKARPQPVGAEDGDSATSQPMRLLEARGAKQEHLFIEPG